MKTNAPEKIYACFGIFGLIQATEIRVTSKDVEYTRTDAFIEKALKWYCLDCACNDNCAANHKCAFWSFFKGYLEGNDKALPPKISNAFNPDGSTTENYRYRHFIRRMQDVFIEKAAKWLDETLRNTDFYENEIELIVEKFKKAMKL